MDERSEQYSYKVEPDRRGFLFYAKTAVAIGIISLSTYSVFTLLFSIDAGDFSGKNNLADRNSLPERSSGPSSPVSSEKGSNEAATTTKPLPHKETPPAHAKPTPKPKPAPRVFQPAQSFLVADLETGTILDKKNPDEQRSIASITKLMTALIAFESLDLQKEVLITKDMVDPERKSGTLHIGDTFKVEDLLYPLLMESSNDAAKAIARSYGEKEFVALMNAKALELGLIQTTFTDPAGLSPNNASTAKNLFALVRQITLDRPEIFAITRLPSYTIFAKDGAKKLMLRNFNVFAAQKNFAGGKTGYTEAAKETMVALFKIGPAETEKTVVIIVLGSDDRKEDVVRLLQQTEQKSP